MTTTLREFQRDFARMRRMAAAGQTVTVRAGDGQEFVFKATGKQPTLGEQFAHLRGSLRTGVRVKSLKGFGRNRS
jgi:hypothetical protein